MPAVRPRFLFPLVLLCVACSGAQVRRVGTAHKDDPSWPRDGGRRIAYAGEIRVAEHLGIRPGFWTRVWRTIVGNDVSDTLYRPFGIAVNKTGRVAIADPGRRSLYVFDPAGEAYTRIKRSDRGPLRYPVAVTFVGDTILAADADAGALLAFDFDGDTAPLPVRRAELIRPAGLAVDAKRGRVYVSDAHGHSVHILSLDPNVHDRTFGKRGGGNGEFNFPTHLTVDDEGRLYVTDALNFRVQVFSPDLQFLRSFGQLGDGPGDFSKPKGVAVDGSGNVFVLDGFFDVVQVFNAKGQLLTVFGGTGSLPGRFYLPGGMAMDGRGYLYVADTFNARVQVFDLMRAGR